MEFRLAEYDPPDFSAQALKTAPDARLVEAPMDGVAPEG